MKPVIRAVLLGLCVVLSAPAAATASTIFIDFEGITEFDPPTAAGVTFANALVLSAPVIGGSLNDFDFPPRSGFNVAFDAGGAITLDFATPVVSFEAFFTYVTGLTLTAFNGVAVVDTAVSTTADNTTSAGGTPNELLSLASAGGITRIEILGSVGGGSFTVDDITAETAAVVAPEPATLWLLGMGAAAMVRRRVKTAA